MKIAVDFDGTCVKHEFPLVGDDCPGAVETLKALADRGHQLILYTMRSGKYLDHAELWFYRRGIPLYGVQSDPQQAAWTSSPKCYAQLYIDDAGYGAPLIHQEDGRPYFDWKTAYWHLTALPVESDANPVVPVSDKEDIL